MKRASLLRIAVFGSLAGLAWATLTLGSALSAGWGAPVRVESIAGTSPDFNYSGLDGCPMESPDGLSFYMASDAPAARAASTSGGRLVVAPAPRGGRRRTSARR